MTRLKVGSKRAARWAPVGPVQWEALVPAPLGQTQDSGPSSDLASDRRESQSTLLTNVAGAADTLSTLDLDKHRYIASI
ncbi:hypothetical protein PGT21_010609 [Puccinia graminis f. sp. tritici]|uniref:Uncharacterized protein n=1 Tax=Puccinia graminis f. sp. tritici TaxID=56615 RepID=A0A5B0PX78_PUCGR|nr:hypothetical protein PGT21_010609 [Puccinia graminis f. sp. tritici]